MQHNSALLGLSDEIMAVIIHNSWSAMPPQRSVKIFSLGPVHLCPSFSQTPCHKAKNHLRYNNIDFGMHVVNSQSLGLKLR